MLIRVVSMIGMATSGVALAIYQTMSERQRREADAKAAEAAQRLFHLALGQLPTSQADRLHDTFP